MIAWFATIAAAQQVVEMPSGEVLASVRVRAMGGAITSVSESATSELFNPAAAAVRRPFIHQNKVSPDLTLQASDHPVLRALGSLVAPPPAVESPARRGHWQLGSNLKVGRDSAALHVRGDAWTLSDTTTMSTRIWGVGLAHATPTWVVGVMPHLYEATRGTGQAWGTGASAGFLLAPTDTPLRVGARARSPLRTGSLELQEGPDAARLPWQLAVGASWIFGAHNEPGSYGPDRVPDVDLYAPKVLVSADLVATGGSADAVGLLPLTEDGVSSQSAATLEVHVGTELELLRRWLRPRAGLYTQPARFASERTLVHVTGGLGVQVFSLPHDLPWRITTVVDATDEGVVWGVGLETW